MTSLSPELGRAASISSCPWRSCWYQLIQGYWESFRKQRRVLACPRRTRAHRGLCSTKLAVASEIHRQARLKVLGGGGSPPEVTSAAKFLRGVPWAVPIRDGWGQKGYLLRVRGNAWEDRGKAGIGEQNFLCLLVPQWPSPSIPPSTHRAAFSAWHLTCTHGSQEHPAPQNGKWYHSLVPQALSSRALGQRALGHGPARQESRMLDCKAAVSDWCSLGLKLTREWLFQET